MRLWLLLTVAVCLMPRIAQAACTTPTGVEGQILYNQDYKLVQYCDGTNWVKLGGSTTDSRIGTLTANKWCAANAGGTGFDCTQNAPAATAGTNTQVIINDGGTLAGAANMLWLKTLNSNAGGLRLGSTSAPTVTLDVTGTAAISGNSTIGGTLGVNGDLSVNTNKFNVTAVSGNTAVAGTLAIGATSAATSSLVDLTSTTLGLLPPRMTTTNRNAIATPATGLMIFNTTSGQFEFYNGTAWTGIGSTTTGQISAFESTTCPSGWTAYTPAYGRFLRGIDPAGTNDTANRTPGTTQTDAFQGHSWQFSGVGTFDGAPLSAGTAAYPIPGYGGGVTQAGRWSVVTDGTNGAPRTAGETRPKNVAVIYCQYSGTGNVAPATATVTGTTGRIAKFTGPTVVGDSIITENGTGIGVGVSSPSNKLVINEDIGATGVPASSLVVGSSSQNSVVSIGQASSSRLAVSWVYNATPASAYAQIVTSASQALVLQGNGGNVGIGTTSPNASMTILGGYNTSLNIYRNYDASTSPAGVDIQLGALNGTTPTVAASIVGFLNTPTTTGDLGFYTRTANALTEKMRIATSGNVGIGTTSPGEKLHVVGSIKAEDPSLAGNSVRMAADSTNGPAVWGHTDSSGNSTFNVSSARLQVGNGGFQVATSPATAIGSARTFTTRMIVEPVNGNVGIGTGSPSRTLDVNGTMNVSSGVISKGATGYGGADLGLYSAGSGLYERFVTNGGNFVWSSDNTASAQIMNLSPSGVLWTSTTGNVSSDRRLKKDVATLSHENGLDSVMRLRPVTYHWINPTQPKELQYGFIAQEIEQVFPAMVGEMEQGDLDHPGQKVLRKTLSYESLFAPMVKAVQELKADNDNQDAEIRELRDEIKALKASIH